MRVEIVSISKKLLLSDILNTNAAYVTRVLREANLHLTCKVTVDEDVVLVAGVVADALRRADVVLGISDVHVIPTRGASDLFGMAVAQAIGCTLDDNGRPHNATVFTHQDPRLVGWALAHNGRVIVCLPGSRQEMAYLLETRILPLLRDYEAGPQTGRLLLRTVGVMESSLKETLSDLQEDPRYQLSFDSFAGQTTIRLAVAPDVSDQTEAVLAELRQAVIDLLGDDVYGEGDRRLEDVVMAQLEGSGRSLAVAECYTSQALLSTLETIPAAHSSYVSSRTNTASELAELLQLTAVSPKDDLTRWNRLAAQRLREQLNTDLGLIVYNMIGSGGVQVMVTLASPLGVSVTQRSFGGHPTHINQWACTLGLAHLRRWLLVYA